jgi:hypothetical protein
MVLAPALEFAKHELSTAIRTKSHPAPQTLPESSSQLAPMPPLNDAKAPMFLGPQ